MHSTRFTSYFPSGNVGALFEPHFVQFDGNLEDKITKIDTLRWRKFSESWQWTVVVTKSQKMVIFLPDGDDFVFRNSNESVLDGPVFL